MLRNAFISNVLKSSFHNFFAKLCLTFDFKIKDIKLVQSKRNGLKKEIDQKTKQPSKMKAEDQLYFFCTKGTEQYKRNTYFSRLEWEEFASFREHKMFHNRLKSFLKYFFYKK